MRVIRRLLPSLRTARGKLGIVAFVTSFLVLASSSASFAYWQNTVTATATVTSADLTIGVVGLSNATFGNESLVSTGSITAQNSTTSPSMQAALVSLTVSGSGTLASKVTRQIWPTSSAGNCTAAASVPTGTPAAVAWNTSTAVTANVTPQNSAYFCVRSTIASRESVQAPGGSLNFAANVAGTIALGNFSGAASATSIQQTMYIYPTYTPDTAHWNWIRPNFENTTYNYCLDVSGGGSTPGTIVISYGCKTSGAINQQWKFTASGIAGYYTITPRNAPALRIDNTSSSSSGTGMIVDTAGATPAAATDQQWQLQQITTGVYEFVNAYSGMCMTSPNGAAQNLGNILQQPCSGSQFQQFLISQAFENFTCSSSIQNGWTFSWTSAATGPYHVYAQGTTTDLATATGATAAGITIATSAEPTQTGTYNVTFVDSNGTVVGLGSITATYNKFLGVLVSSSSSCVATDPSN